MKLFLKEKKFSGNLVSKINHSFIDLLSLYLLPGRQFPSSQLPDSGFCLDNLSKRVRFVCDDDERGILGHHLNPCSDRKSL